MSHHPLSFLHLGRQDSGLEGEPPQPDLHRDRGPRADEAQPREDPEGGGGEETEQAGSQRLHQRPDQGQGQPQGQGQGPKGEGTGGQDQGGGRLSEAAPGKYHSGGRKHIFVINWVGFVLFGAITGLASRLTNLMSL